MTSPRAPDDRGFTVVEVLVAALMMALIVGAAATLFAHGSDASVATQRQSQLISVADQQIEKVRQEVKTEGFNALAMSGQPVALNGLLPNSSYSSTLDVDPNSFVQSVTGCGSSNQEYMIQSNYDNTTEGISNLLELLPWATCTNSATQVGEPLEILTGYGFVAPQQTVSVGSDTAVVDTYVTDTYVGCNAAQLSGCPATSGGSVSCSSWPTTSGSTTCGDARRVTVAVVLDDHGRYTFGPSGPVYVSTVFANPTPSNAPSSSIGFTVGAKIG